ncbi:MAG TPA: reverse transcriptase domain-containing protein [Candidatus Polarisedimenticolia bacterium]|nr:reverse transcriptase domain-containing protein [Candidatus Polarisedimenticolia bacterium]
MSDGSGAPTGPTRQTKSGLTLQVRKRRVIEAAWFAIKRNARTSKSQETKNEIAAFEENLATNLKRLSRELQQNRFVFPPARGIKIPKDKKDKASFRPLVVARVESRIVQRAIHDVLVSVPAIQKFVHTPYSFGGIRKKKDEDMAAVPAAIKAVLNSIGEGSRFVIRSDIAKFFTRIPKSAVTDIVAKAVEEKDFIELFARAIAVELENMEQLREHANAFPIEDIGVAQGNSLSPLLGNLFLYDFDSELNKKPDVRCIRYIDDFIILAPNKEIAANTFAKAQHMLTKLGLSVSRGKTQGAEVEHGFEFLGIDLSNGFIRPSKKARERLLASIESTLIESRIAFREHTKTGVLANAQSLLESLGKVSGVMQGWGKHYRFCNDSKCFERLDQRIETLIKAYLAVYREERGKTDDPGRWRLLGIEALAQIEREPFIWPKKKS